MKRKFRLLLTIAPSVYACAGDNPSSDGIMVRDSAGIRVVEYSTSWEAPEWYVSQNPRVVIGSRAADTTELLFQVEGALRLGDGRIVVANRGTNQLRYYDSDGAFLQAIGRHGGGPGEFDYLTWIERCANDSVYTYDIGNRRLSLFDAKGEFVRAGPLMLPDGGNPYGEADCSRHGVFLLAGWARNSPQPGLHRHDQPIALVSEAGDSVGHLGYFPGVDRWGTVSDGRLTGSMPLPLGRTLVHTLIDSLAIVGTGDAYELRGFGFDGTLRLLIRRQRDNPRVTQADIETFVTAQLAGRSDNDRRRAEGFWAEMEFPDSLPAYSQLLGDADDNLWVRDYPRPGAESVRWDVYDKDGLQIGSVTIPTDIRVTDIGADYMMAIVRDEFDVQFVHVYDLRRTI